MPNIKTIRQRIHAGFVLAVAFLLVLASNRLNNRNFSAVEHGVDSVFEDRLVVQEYIYRLSNLFHKKELFLANGKLGNQEIPETPTIESILVDFGNTELTREESRYLESLKKNYTTLQGLEANHAEYDEPKKEMIAVLHRIGENLDALSEVQLDEGKLLTEQSKRSLGMNQLLSTIEIVFLIIIGILFLIIVFKKDRPEMEVVGEDSQDFR
jgi:hypothetical protein